MHCYETIFILHPDLSDEGVDQAKKRVGDLIDKHGGRVYYQEDWGKKRLAYEVARQRKGTYCLIRHVSGNTGLNEAERLFRFDEEFLKYLTVRLKTDPANAGAEPPRPRTTLRMDDDEMSGVGD